MMLGRCLKLSMKTWARSTVRQMCARALGGGSCVAKFLAVLMKVQGAAAVVEVPEMDFFVQSTVMQIETRKIQLDVWSS